MNCGIDGHSVVASSAIDEFRVRNGRDSREGTDEGDWALGCGDDRRSGGKVLAVEEALVNWACIR
jgi:hypothetical protein